MMYHEGGPYETDLGEQCLSRAEEVCPVTGTGHACGRSGIGNHVTHQCHYCGTEWSGKWAWEDEADGYLDNAIECLGLGIDSQAPTTWTGVVHTAGLGCFRVTIEQVEHE